MAAETKKCAHPACNCLVDKNTKYCSQYCHDSGRTTEITCNCRHAACEANVAAAASED